MTPPQATILIIDDNPINLSVLLDALEEYNFELRIASSGKIALAGIEYSKPDIILLDIMMPEMDGFEVCRHLKENPETKNIPVIFMTALASQADEIQGFQIGAADYITKPIQIERALARINTQLTLSKIQKDHQKKTKQLEEEAKQRQQAEYALRKSEKRYRHLIENAPLGIISFDSNGKIIDLNPMLLTILGSPSAEATKAINALKFPPLIKAGFVKDFQHCLKTGQSTISQHLYSTKWGKQLYLRFHLTPMYNNLKQIIGIEAIAEDITQQQQAELALRASEAKFRSLITNSPDIIVIVNKQAKLLFSNYIPENRSLDEMIGDEIYQHIPPDNHETYQQTLSQTFKTGNPYHLEVKTADGKIWMNRFAPIQQQNKIDSVMIVITDITEQKKMETTLQENINFLTTLMNTIPTPIFFKDKQGIYQGCNSAFEKIVGIPETELVGKSVYDIAPKNLAHKYHQQDLELIKTPGIQIYESEVRYARDKQLHNVIFHKATYLNSNGQASGLVGVILDITDRKKDEEALRQYERIVSATSDHISLIDKNYIYQVVNEAYLIANNKKYNEIVGHSVQNFLGGDTFKNSVKQNLDKALNGQVVNYQDWFQFKNKNKKQKFMSVTYSPYLDATNNIAGVVVSARDITKRKLAEDATNKANIALLKANLQMQEDLILAQEIQYSLLPATHPEWPIDIACYTNPARQIGGDFYNYHNFGDGRLALIVGDISGKGVSAALLMAASLAQLDAILLQDFNPAQRLSYLDTAIMLYTKPRSQNCAMCYAELTPPTQDQPGTLQIVNAGSIPPYIKRKNGSIEWPQIGGFALGQGLGATIEYEQITLNIYKGDMIILTSDGVVEAKNQANKMLGFDQLKKIIQHGPQTSAKAMLKHLKQKTLNFIGKAEQHDDITILIVQT